MSVVWARDVGSEWNDNFGKPFRHANGQQMNQTRMISPMDNCDKEGYSGTPRSFIDVDDPRIRKKSIEYNERGRNEFRKNMELVKSLIKSGVVYPTGGMIYEIVNKLREIAKK